MISFVLLPACAGGVPRHVEPVRNTADGPAVREPRCVPPTTAASPLTREELELPLIPDDDEVARALLRGIWDGHSYDLDGELGELESNPRAGAPIGVCFDARGHMMEVAHERRDRGQRVAWLDGDDDEPAARTDCTPRSTTYALRRDDEDKYLELEIVTTGGCPGRLRRLGSAVIPAC